MSIVVFHRNIFMALTLLIGIMAPGVLTAASPPAPHSPITIPLAVQLDRPAANELTDNDLQRIAARFRAVVDRFIHFSPEQIARLHSLRPDIHVLRYINLSSVYGKGMIQRLRKKHPEWILKDRRGRNIQAFYGHGVALDPRDPQLAQYVESLCRRATVSLGYDGIMADETFMAHTLPRGFAGVDRASGQAYDTDAWRQAKLS